MFSSLTDRCINVSREYWPAFGGGMEDKQNAFFISFVSGAVAGAVAKTTIAPLDRTKTVVSPNPKSFCKAEMTFLSKWRKFGGAAC